MMKTRNHKGKINSVGSYLTVLLMSISVISLAGTSTDAVLSKRIHQLHEQVVTEGRTTQQLSESDLASLPVGIASNVAGFEYLVIIDSARFTPTGAFFDAYISLPFKQNGQRIAFAARNIAFHRGGISASNEAHLALVGDQHLSLGSKIHLDLPSGDKQNYVVIDCNGFKAVNLLGKIIFDRELLIPEDEQGESLPGQVETEFRVVSTDWNAMLISVSLPTFRLPSLPGISFQVEKATLDMSDLANPTGIVFPDQYTQQYGANAQLWEGFFIHEARVGLFKELSHRGERRYISARNLILDKQGVSGGIGVSNLFDREEGSLNGWPFSVDSLGIVLVKNKLSGGGFRGEMNIPLFSRDAPLKYSALITQMSGETVYTFAVQPGTNLEASALAAKINLAPNSTVIITKHEGRLKPEAILHGTLSVNAGSGIRLKEVAFTDLHIASEAPYVRNGFWSFSNGEGQTAADYPISVEAITFQHNKNDLELGVAALLGMMNQEDKGFSARTQIKVRGEIVEADTTSQEDGTIIVTQQEWKYKDTQIDDIAIEADMDAFSLNGRISLYEKHEVYGQGFRGEIEASFKAGPTLKAIAQFGRVEDYRYWYVDGLMHHGSTTPSPGFAVYGFGGGAYYQMAMERKEIAPGDFHTIEGNQDQSTIGATRSGATYVPDKSVKLGVKATVVIGTAPSPRPFNGDANFEITFNRRMGVKYLRFRGEGYFLTGLDERNDSPPMYADLSMGYDFDNRELNGLLDLYVDAYGVIRGVNPRGHAGSAILHFGEDSWYVWLGTPSQSMGINIAGLAESKAYMMVGDEMEGAPPPLDGVQVTAKNLQEVLDRLGENRARTGTYASQGKGFAFGASFATSIGKDDPGAVFYGFFKASAGFDVMLQDMGNVTCKGRSGPIGIKGWYASGLVWAYLAGAVGINVNLKFVKGKFEAFRFLAAIVMQAQMPNPTWVQGTAFGEFSILNGLVKGDCNFQVTLGEQCELESGPPITTEVIADMQPVTGSREVDVFTSPQVAFNIGVNTPIEMLNLQDKIEQYRVKLNHFRVTDNGVPLEGEVRWNDDNTVAVFETSSILPAERSLKAEVQITWQEQIQGTWTDLDFTESRQVTFTSGKAPNYIPDNNVDYSYPVRDQYTFLPKEYSTGYMKLKKGQDYLFNTKDEKTGQTWIYVARFQRQGASSYTDKSLTQKGRMLSYSVPTNLANETVYRVSFIKKPVETVTINQNVRRTERKVELAQAENVTAAERSLLSARVQAGEEILFTYGLRTSRYNTFSAKVKAMNSHATTAGVVQDIQIFEVGTRLTMPEVFDAAELNGTHGKPAMLRMYADLDNPWFTTYMERYYQYYPIHSQVTIDWRTPNVQEPRPKYTIKPELRATAPVLTANQRDFGGASIVSGDVMFKYQVPTYTYKDYFFDLRPKALSRYGTQSSAFWPAGASPLINNTYQQLQFGQYNIELEYVPPGLTQPSSTQTITITW